MTWVIDSKRFAKKVKQGTSSGSNADNIPSQSEDGKQSCPTCGQSVCNDKVFQEWPGVPAGVKFDPNDKELLDHLAAKIGRDGTKSHPLIDEFIPTLDGDDGICYTHPEKLPGVNREGRTCHFFHRPANAYTKGTRKRRKVHTGEDEDGGETRWHKTGKTRCVFGDNGELAGWKKIMVLYTNFKKKAKPKKTNWVLHQYHLGNEEDEREGELVVSKVFYQTQPRHCSSKKPTVSDDEDVPQAEESDPTEPQQQQQQHQFSNIEEFSRVHGQCITNGASTLSRPIPSTPEVVRPLAIREPRPDILEPVVTPLECEISLGVPTPDGTRGRSFVEDIEAEDITGVDLDETSSQLRCDEKIQGDSCLPSLDFAADLGLDFDEGDDNAGFNLDGFPLGTPPDFLEDPVISSQEIYEWFSRKRRCSQEVPPAGDSQSGIFDIL